MSLWELHEAPDLVALQGQKSMKIVHKRIQDQKIFVFKIALNHVLTLPDCRSRRPLSESVFRSQKGPLGVELWSFYCKKRISVPMSYITFLHSSICLQNVCFPHKLINYWPRMYAFRISSVSYTHLTLPTILLV